MLGGIFMKKNKITEILKTIINNIKYILGKSIKEVKNNRKVQLSLVAGIVVVTLIGWTSYYFLGKDDNKDSNENKVVSDIIISSDEKVSKEDADVILSEDKEGNVVAKDKEGNVIAKGDEVAKIVEEKQAEGKIVVTETKEGTVAKVDRVETSSTNSNKDGTTVAVNTNNSKPSSGNSDSNKPSSIKPSSGNSSSGTSSSSGSNSDSSTNSGGSFSGSSSTGSSSNSNTGSGSSSGSSSSGNTGSGSSSSNSGNNSSSNSGQTTPSPTPEPTPSPTPTPSPEPAERTWTFMEDMSRETFNLMNQFRQQNGVAPLAWSDSEFSKAKVQAESNAKNSISKHDFNQISLLRGSSDRDYKAKDFINQWEASIGHKESMLESVFIEGAVAVYKDSDGIYYAVASFYDGW